MMKLWTGGLGSEGERRIIDLSHLRRFSSSSAGEIDNGGTAESLVCRIRENHVGCLFRDHVNRRDNEKSRNSWEDRGVDDPQPLGPIDLEITVEDRHRIIPFADLASAGGMVAPGVSPHELRKLCVGFQMLPRKLFFRDQPLVVPVAFQPGGQSPHEADSIDYGRQVLFTAFTEVMEID